ncbi:MAG: cysteine synthase [Pseudomonadota bacterium]
MTRIADSILDLVGNTPMVRITRMNPNPEVNLLAKLEFMNPGGSVKDRIGQSMIEAAEEAGDLRPGMTVLEASSGNTAIGLAMACAVKGYALAVTMAESASEERKKILRAYGAELILTPGHLGTDGAIEEAYRLAREQPKTYVLTDQFNNDANWQAHYHGTGPEIVEATGGEVDVVVMTMGTTGTLMGTSRFFREHHPKVRVIGVEPFKGHKIQGLKNMKESYPPGIFDPDLPHEIVHVADDLAYDVARQLARKEGIFVGMSAGAAMAAAMEVAAGLTSGTVVALLPDGGERYLSTSLFVSQIVPEPLRFHNTLTRTVEALRPLKEGRIGIYSCGPSLDGPPGLGLSRRMVFADVLVRYLRSRGYAVEHVVNLGDIDDRTISECLAAGEPLETFTARWEKTFFADMDALGVGRPDHTPRASEHVAAMVDATRTLLEKGYAYEKLRSVYFGIRRLEGYGRLSQVDLDKVQAPPATTYDYYEKDSPQDFTLFKRSTLAELKAGIYWQTPWGNARPGWHVECAAISAALLGQPFDIHTSGTNLVFPHGDNEIAIAEGRTGGPLANLWMHAEIVTVDGCMEGRGNGRCVTLRQLLDKGWDPAALRFWLLGTHYRKVLHFDEDELHRADTGVRRLRSFADRVRSLRGGAAWPELDQLVYEARSGWHACMDEDLSMPRALAILFNFVRTVNKRIDDGCLTEDQRTPILALLREIDGVLGVIDLAEDEADAGIDAAVVERDAARDAGDFARADALRLELANQGVVLQDTPSGTVWRRERVGER